MCQKCVHTSDLNESQCCQRLFFQVPSENLKKLSQRTDHLIFVGDGEGGIGKFLLSMIFLFFQQNKSLQEFIFYHSMLFYYTYKKNREAEWSQSIFIWKELLSSSRSMFKSVSVSH